MANLILIWTSIDLCEWKAWITSVKISGPGAGNGRSLNPLLAIFLEGRKHIFTSYVIHPYGYGTGCWNNVLFIVWKRTLLWFIYTIMRNISCFLESQDFIHRLPWWKSALTPLTKLILWCVPEMHTTWLGFLSASRDFDKNRSSRIIFMIMLSAEHRMSFWHLCYECLDHIWKVTYYDLFIPQGLSHYSRKLLIVMSPKV